VSKIAIQPLVKVVALRLPSAMEMSPRATNMLRKAPSGRKLSE
jgi:hypothetical protein